jgi:hypothetical protein
VHALVEPAADDGEVGALDRLDGHVRDHDVAPGRQGVDEMRHTPLRVVRVGHDVQDSDQQQADWPAQVQSRRRVGEHRVGTAEVAQREGGGAGGATGEKGMGMGEHDGVVVDVHDARRGRELLGQLVGVGRVGDARADVEELTEADFAGQEPHRPPEEGAVGAGIGAGAVEPARVSGERVGRDLPVDGEVVRAAQRAAGGTVRRVRIFTGTDRARKAPWSLDPSGPCNGPGAKRAPRVRHHGRPTGRERTSRGSRPWGPVSA